MHEPISRYSWKVLACCAACSIVAGCAEPVLTQSVPVSSSPLGAAVYADGQLAGNTPLTLELTRNRDHLVTLVQPGYRQADILVAREYLPNEVLMHSMQAGINTGTFFNDPVMGMNAALGTVQQDKESGAAYRLVPPALVVPMLRVGMAAPPPPIDVPPYNGAPIYPAYPPAAAVSPDAAVPAAAAAAAFGAAAAGAGIPAFNRENTQSKTTSTTTTRSFVGPGGGTETQSTTTAKTSGTTFGFGYQGSGNGPAAPGPDGGPAMPNIATPQISTPPMPAMPSPPSMGAPPGLSGGVLP